MMYKKSGRGAERRGKMKDRQIPPSWLGRQVKEMGSADKPGKCLTNCDSGYWPQQ